MAIRATLGNVPFTEAIANLQQKSRIPTRRWDELMGAPHARAFTVAGATRLALLEDIQQSLVQALASGQSLETWTTQFKQILETRGWRPRGGAEGRAQTIYNTNMASARAAGRWQQIEEVKQSRPYLEYLAVLDDQTRDEHASLHGTIRPIDDSFWDTHYPPNGYNCRCTVRTLSERDLQKRGARVTPRPDTPPTQTINTVTGEVHTHPVGTLPGFDTNVGKTWLGSDIAYGERLMRLPASQRGYALTTLPAAYYTQLTRAFISWSRTALATGKRTSGAERAHTVGWLSPSAIRGLRSANAAPDTAAITVGERALRALVESKTLTPAEALRLPQRINNPTAVLLDTTNRSLVYVIGSGNDRRAIRVQLRPTVSGDRNRVNELRGAVDPATLTGERYRLIAGSLSPQ